MCRRCRVLSFTFIAAFFSYTANAEGIDPFQLVAETYETPPPTVLGNSSEGAPNSRDEPHSNAKLKMFMDWGSAWDFIQHLNLEIEAKAPIFDEHDKNSADSPVNLDVTITFTDVASTSLHFARSHVESSEILRFKRANIDAVVRDGLKVGLYFDADSDDEYRQPDPHAGVSVTIALP